MAQRNARQFRDCFSEVLTASAVLSPALVTTGTTGVASTITVPGVVLGDTVIACACSAAIGALHLQGEVTAADTVTLKFANTTAGSLTPPAAATYSVICGKTNPGLFV